MQEDSDNAVLGGMAIGLLRVLSLLPLRVLHGIGGLGGRIMLLLNTESCRRARRNLARVFPEDGDREREALLRATLVETGRTATELAVIWFWPVGRVLDMVREIDGEQYLKDASGNGRPTILLTPHLGQWELMGLFAARYGPLTSLYRPMRRPGLESTITQARGRSGNRLVPTTSRGIRGLFAALRRNEMLGILPDQVPPPGSGMPAPFFGIEVYTMVLVSKLAGGRDVDVLLTYAERLPRSRGFRVVVMPVDDAIRSTDLATSVAALNAAVETAVRRQPAQYQWIYKRFKLKRIHRAG
jgi:Kdo2-lipid IVA lauroyltransferase/acyltransferase